ncbi:hypothetical protein [Pseudoalteromonas denitrificans]|uniref:Fibronectin type III domain-containing protein n=1 Tax=Pseudoalteromonas denitrificans DSM 6059 TaxID=1123010 RepID=A0A1I1S6W1_9GAMM|nr:hypothetical protein [Pseudoalteromonas denitrificans]SFD42249.1 hypothetical protein SAMN02745724_04478 [Pseudoalteromonas denitrificans DSM 6059]
MKIPRLIFVFCLFFISNICQADSKWITVSAGEFSMIVQSPAITPAVNPVILTHEFRSQSGELNKGHTGEVQTFTLHWQNATECKEYYIYDDGKEGQFTYTELSTKQADGSNLFVHTTPVRESAYIMQQIITCTNANGASITSELINRILSKNSKNSKPILASNKSYQIVSNNVKSLVLSDFIITDDDDDQHDLIVMQGTNYSLDNNSVIPSPGFIGTLNIPVKVNDGKDDSNTVTVLLEVIKLEVLEAPNEWITVSAGEFSMIIPKPESAENNVKPMLSFKNQLEMNVNDVKKLTLNDFVINDDDNQHSLIILSGANYSLNNNIIIPDADFIGSLIVPVKVNDGVNDSNIVNVKIRVTDFDSPYTITAEEIIQPRPYELSGKEYLTFRNLKSGNSQFSSGAIKNVYFNNSTPRKNDVWSGFYRIEDRGNYIDSGYKFIYYSDKSYISSSLSSGGETQLATFYLKIMSPNMPSLPSFTVSIDGESTQVTATKVSGSTNFKIEVRFKQDIDITFRPVGEHSVGERNYGNQLFILAATLEPVINSFSPEPISTATLKMSEVEQSVENNVLTWQSPSDMQNQGWFSIQHTQPNGQLSNLETAYKVEQDQYAYSFSADLILGTHQVELSACNLEGRCSDTVLFRFTVVPKKPNMVTNINLTPTQMYGGAWATLSWLSSGYYEPNTVFEVFQTEPDTKTSYLNNVAHQSSVISYSKKIKLADTPGVYSYQIKTCTGVENKLCSKLSDPINLTVKDGQANMKAPEFTEFPESLVNGRSNIGWTPVAGAPRYILEARNGDQNSWSEVYRGDKTWLSDFYFGEYSAGLYLRVRACAVLSCEYVVPDTGYNYGLSRKITANMPKITNHVISPLIGIAGGFQTLTLAWQNAHECYAGHSGGTDKIVIYEGDITTDQKSITFQNPEIATDLNHNVTCIGPGGQVSSIKKYKTVNISAPVSVNAELKGGILIAQWPEVKQAKGYQVYYREEGTLSWEKVYVGVLNSISNKQLASSEKGYRVKVRACITDNCSEKTIAPNYRESVLINASMPRITEHSYSTGYVGKEQLFSLSWENANYCYGESSRDNWSSKGIYTGSETNHELNSDTFKHITPIRTEVESFEHKVTCIGPGGEVISTLKNEVKYAKNLPAPITVIAQLNNGNLSVNWPKVFEANAYQLSYQEQGSTAWEKLYSGPNLKITEQKISSSEIGYKVRVRACIDKDCTASTKEAPYYRESALINASMPKITEHSYSPGYLGQRQIFNLSWENANYCYGESSRDNWNSKGIYTGSETNHELNSDTFKHITPIRTEVENFKHKVTCIGPGGEVISSLVNTVELSDSPDRDILIPKLSVVDKVLNWSSVKNATYYKVFWLACTEDCKLNEFQWLKAENLKVNLGVFDFSKEIIGYNAVRISACVSEYICYGWSNRVYIKNSGILSINVDLWGAASKKRIIKD